MDALLTTIVLWLAANFNLPVTSHHPKIEIVPPMEIVFMRYGAFTPEARRDISSRYVTAGASGRGREVVAVYAHKRNAILLPQGWSGATPAEMSVLVHELVHHLQESAGLPYECPAAREKAAYAAQEKWLGLFGLSLLSEFDIDAFTLKISTECGY
ncbi:MAG: DUF6647 family protein [Bradyrhizobium sp.]